MNGLPSIEALASSRADAQRARGSAPTPPPKPADPLDAWLCRGLHRQFDAVVGEPVPEDLLRLIEEDRAERERIGDAAPSVRPGVTPQLSRQNEPRT